LRDHLLPAQRIGVLTVQILINAAFVHIYKAFWR
jgi:hypothetical protein